MAIEALYINFLENVVKQTWANETEGRKMLHKAAGSFANDQLLKSDRFQQFVNDIKITWNSSSAIDRSEEHTSELQAPVPNSYAVFCLKKKLTYGLDTSIERAKKPDVPGCESHRGKSNG